MIKEALEFLLDKGRNSRTPHLLDVPGDPTHIKRIIDADGKVQEITLDPGPRFINCKRLSDIIDLINANLDFTKGPMFVCVCADRVDLVLDTKNGRERARLELLHTEELSFFRNRIEEPRIDPRDLRTALRYKLRDTMDESSLAGLIEQISKYNLNIVSQENVSVDRGGESLGRQVQSEANAPVGMPQEIQRFLIRPWANHDLESRYPIECILDPDSSSKRWILYPIESSLIRFYKGAVDDLFARIKDSVADKEAASKVHLSYASGYKNEKK